VKRQKAWEGEQAGVVVLEEEEVVVVVAAVAAVGEDQDQVVAVVVGEVGVPEEDRAVDLEGVPEEALAEALEEVLAGALVDPAEVVDLQFSAPMAIIQHVVQVQSLTFQVQAPFLALAVSVFLCSKLLEEHPTNNVCDSKAPRKLVVIVQLVNHIPYAAILLPMQLYVSILSIFF